MGGKSRSALLVDTRPLRRQPGSSHRMSVEVPITDDLGNDICRMKGESVRVALLLESVLDGILVSASLRPEVSAECVRCLDPVTLMPELEFRQFFVYPGAEADGDEGDDDAEPMHGDDIDLGPAFRDCVLLALPLTPTCTPDCPGLCPECGAKLADDPGHRHEHLDPRWSALARWQESDAEPEGD